MPRVTASESKWRVSWRNLLWCLIWVVVGYGACWLVRVGAIVPGVLLLLLAALGLSESLKSLWRNRYTFVFTVRGNRKVKFTPHFRDEIIFEENGRKLTIYTEMLVGEVSRAIYASSINKWDAPHDQEPLTEEQKEDILALLCEQYDYEGTRYEVIMSSHLLVSMRCPRCEQESNMKIGLPFGRIKETSYQVGDRIEWQQGWPSDKGGRPQNGNLTEQSGGNCPLCGRDFHVIVHVKADILESMEIDLSREYFIPDSSTPIIENGRVTGHIIDPKKR